MAAIRITQSAFEILGTRGGIQITPPDTLAVFLFQHDWIKELEMETTSQNEVSHSPSGSRECRNLVSKPTRIITLRWAEGKISWARAMLWDLIRHGNNRILIPLSQDTRTLTGDAVGTFLPCNTAHARYFPQGKALLYERHPHSRIIGEIFSVTIASTDSTGITLVDAPPTAPNATWRIAPAIYIEISLEGELAFVTDEIAVLENSWEEVYGPETMRMVEDGNPGGFAVFLGYPVFYRGQNWAQEAGAGYIRQGESFRRGKAEVVEVRESRPRITTPFEITCESRAASWDVLRFLESRRGRARPFWIAGHNAIGTPITIEEQQITIEAERRILNYQDFLPAISLRMKNGDLHLARVNEITEGINTWTISLLDSLPLGLEPADVRRMSYACLCQLSSDSYTERWTTDGICHFSFQAHELLNEQDLEAPNLDPTASFVVSASRIFISAPEPFFS